MALKRSLRTGGIGLCAMLVLPSAVAGGACEARSGPQRALLVELYTSEGCSSCPPADRWLGGLADAAKRGDVVPLAFHVDYWDYLGWRDPYARAAFSQRQREAAWRQRERTVFTPQVLADSRTLYDWRDHGAFAGALAQVRAHPASVDLRLMLDTAGPTPSVHLNAVKHPGAPTAADVYLARWESGLQSAVRAGENSGALLRHDFVVREWIGPLAFNGSAALNLERPSPGGATANSGWAAVAMSADGNEVLQALSLPLADCAGAARP